ncbi:hypothetical protein PSTT_16695 [Puccinia striiformis]|uniref:DUF7872 domain-containing protein n=1 Tax=Puccinia striiformis TaxID=27350 RepID=A0A2S4UBR3_9BASI|nr:hypothetical protein PSTT_16695 [Puccinia striiformis]
MLSNFVLSFSILVVLFASLTLVESGTYGGTQVTLPIREKKLPPIVTTDTTGTTNATGTTGTNSTTSALALTNTSKICDVESPTPEQFAEQHGVYNFKCGIGDTCDAGQICAPIPGPVWHVLYAVQQWHHIQESLNRALAFAANTLIVTGSQISTDLFPPGKEKSDHLSKVSFILALVGAIIATISAAAFLWVPGVNNILIMGAIGAVGAAVATGQAVTTIQAQQAFDSMKSDAFSRWAGYTEAITKWQEGMQKQLFDDTKRALGLGINDPAGLGGVLANGALFTNTLQKTTYDIEKTLEDVVKRRLINGILREKKAFVTVNSDECKQGGPNGAFKSEDGWLSWCKDGKMMNIIYADGNKSGNKLYNGGMIPAKYGITVEYMTTQSENCQIKYGGYGHDPYGDGYVSQFKFKFNYD